MKKHNFVILGLLLFFVFSLNAQEIDYHRLQSEGEVPTDFLTNSIEDYERSKDRLQSEDDDRDILEYKESFLAKSKWHLNRILKSGIIVYNDTITNYVRKVADTVLQDFPGIRNELRFYTATHSSVNAFSTDAGVIIFNTGLIAQLENEAQLAFVIAHEVVHYYKKHSIKGYIVKQKVSQEIKDVEALSKDKHLALAKNNRSREKEFEADKIGFQKFFSTTDYSRQAAMGVMDVLQYSYLPLNEVKFSSSILTNKYFSIPDKFLLYEVSLISAGDDYEDKMSTHPSVRKRRESLKKRILRENKSDKGNDFIISENKFQKVRKKARKSTIRRHMIETDYPRAIYDAFIMLQNNHNDPYMQKVIAGALYGTAVYKSNYSGEPLIDNYKEIEGESQQVYYLLNKLPDVWTNVIAVQYAWRLHKLYPDDRYLNNILEHLLFTLIDEHKIHLDDFYENSKEAYLAQKDSIINLNDPESEKLESKYDRIKKKNKKNQVSSGEEEYRFAFVDMLKDQEFIDAYEDAEEEVKETNEKEEVSYADIKKKLSEEKEQKKKENYGFRVGVDRAIMLDPLFLSINQKKEEEIQFFKTDQKKQVLSQLIEENSREVNLDAIMFDPWRLDTNDTEKYNEIMLMKDWKTEYFNHEGLRIYPFATNDIYPVMEKYDVRYLNYTGVVNGRVTDLSSNKGCSYFYLLAFPMAIYEWVKPTYKMVLFSTLIDLKSAKTMFSYKSSVPNRAGKYRMKTRIYDLLKQIKTKDE